MGLRQQKWAKRVKLKLRKLLGRQCKQCGKKRKLEFDVIHPNGDGHGKIEWSWRMSYYRKQFDRNNLQLLCKKCNQKKSDNLVLIHHQTVEAPF